MIPIMLIRNFTKIKVLGVIITILNFSLILLALIFYIYDLIADNNGDREHHHKPPVAYPRDYDSGWFFAARISFAFEY